MKRIKLLSAIMWSTGFATAAAQNIVPNPGFEELSGCPGSWAQLTYATGWESFRGTPDLFNSCASLASGFSTPTGKFGTVAPFDGEGYAGLYCYYPEFQNRREYVGAQLTEPLVPGVPTYISFKVASSAGAGGTFRMKYWTSHMGAKFSMAPWYEDYEATSISNSAAVFSPEVITDQPVWSTVSGTYTPDSAYAYVVIGNFFSDALTGTALTNSSGPAALTAGSYYFVDHVCVTQGSPGTCFGHDGVEAISAPSAFRVAFNGSANSIDVFLGKASGATAIDVLDAMGRILLSREVQRSPGTYSLSAVDLPRGPYLVKLRGAAGLPVRKVVLR